MRLLKAFLTIFVLWSGNEAVFSQGLSPLLERIVRYEAKQQTDSLYDAYVKVGNLYLQDSIYGKAVDYYQSALKIAPQLSGTEARQKECYWAIAHAYLYGKKYPEAISQYQRLLELYQKDQNTDKEKEVLGQLSHIYKLHQNIPEALAYSQRLLELGQKLNDRLTQINAYNNIGVIYNQQNKHKEAGQYFLKALEANKPSVLPVEQHVLLLLNAGYYYTLEKNYRAAEKQYKEVEQISISYPEGQANALNALSTLSFLQKNRETALNYAHSALAVAKENLLTEQIAESYFILSKLYEAEQDARQSQYYYKQYLEAKEEGEKQARDLDSKRMQDQLEAEKQENDVKLFLAEKDRQALELDQMKLIAEKKAQELEVSRQQMQLLTQEQELQKKTLANQLLERQRIALEKERIQQALLLAQREIESAKQNQQIESLKKDKEIEMLAKKDREQEVALLQADAEIQRQVMEQQKSFKMFIVVLASLFGILLIVTLVWLYQKQRSNRLLQKREQEILRKNEELLATEEELRQNAEELIAVNERLEDEKQKTEEAFKALQAAKSQMVQSEKMVSLGLLTAGIAHEINNPINFIAGGAQGLKMIINDLIQILDKYMALNATQDDAEKQTLLQEIDSIRQRIGAEDELKEDALVMIAEMVKGVDRVTEIITGLRNFSRADDGQYVVDELHGNINNTLLILRNRYKDRIEIVKNFDASIQNIECYPGPLGQVFMNIINNAIDAIPDKGTIAISTRNLGKTVAISIKDTGAGIPNEIKDKIFDPFFTTKDVGHGTGLGLSIVHGIIEKHKGSIEVVSAPGKGTEFVITLPK